MIPEKLLHRFQEKWGDQFDYSDAEYCGYKGKMHIFCKKHNNWFWQTPETHLKFNGCKQCSAELKSNVRRMPQDEFINRSKKLYGDKFDYSKVQYINNNTNVIVTCSKHGDISVNPAKFLNGCGCTLCNKEKPNPNIKPFSDVLKQFRETHGDKYEYDKTTFSNMSSKIRIICPEHGEFWQTPLKHLSGQGCPACGRKRIADGQRLSLEEFIDKANKKHNFKYDYHLIKNFNLQDKVEIICPEHGSFFQKGASHLNGCGCPLCATAERNKNATKTTEEFINEAKKIHDGDNYDYSRVHYVNRSTPVEIICPKHGSFMQNPSKHLIGHGCLKCAASGIHFNGQEYISRANEVHKGKYSYGEVNIKNVREKIKITCPIHGDFYQEAESHLQGHGCPKCSNSVSEAEVEIFDFIRSLLPNELVINRDRTVLNGKEIDILIPSYGIGVEYNGLYWHSEKFVGETDSMLRKSRMANERGINLIHIFEDEWLYKKDIVKSKLKHILMADMDLPRIMGRKCLVKEITAIDANDFLNANHIQGAANATVRIGAFFEDKLIAVMTFNEIDKKEKRWDLNRYASDINYRCQGVASKMLSYFLKNYEITSIKSFADRRWTLSQRENLYTKLGFRLDKVLPPDYRYFINGRTKLERIHKFNFRKQNLNKKYGFPLTMTESEMAEQLHAVKIWDCGLLKYVWGSDVSTIQPKIAEIKTPK